MPKPYCREACRDTQSSIRLASHLVRAPNSRSGGHEFESPVWRELGALTKMERSLGSVLSTEAFPRNRFRQPMKPGGPLYDNPITTRLLAPTDCSKIPPLNAVRKNYIAVFYAIPHPPTIIIFKLLNSIPPGNVSWRAGTINLFLFGS